MLTSPDSSESWNRIGITARDVRTILRYMGGLCFGVTIWAHHQISRAAVSREILLEHYVSHSRTLTEDEIVRHQLQSQLVTGFTDHLFRWCFAAGTIALVASSALEHKKRDA